MSNELLVFEQLRSAMRKDSLSIRSVPGPNTPRALLAFLALRSDPLGELEQARHRYGDVFKLALGPVVSTIVWRPEHLAHVLQKKSKNYGKRTPSYGPLRPLLGRGLLTAEGPFWLRQRRLCQPSFNRENLGFFADSMLGSIDELVTRWGQRSFEANVVDHFMRLTLQIVGRTLFGSELAAHSEKVHESVTVTLEHANRESYRLWSPPLWTPSPHNLQVNRHLRRLRRLIDGLVRDGKANRRPGTLLHRLLEARDPETGESMSDEQLRDELMTFMFAGHETTAVAIAWTFYLLSQNPAVENRLHSELDAVLGESELSQDALSELPYTLAVFKEAMRLYPPVWSFTRRVLHDDHIGGHPIRKSTLIWLAPYLTHRSAEFWPDPLRFDPERFLPERESAIKRYAYLPFSVGPRQCIGNHFALMEGHLAVAAIARRYRLRLSPEQNVVPHPSVTMRPKGGLRMRIDARS